MESTNNHIVKNMVVQLDFGWILEQAQ